MLHHPSRLAAVLLCQIIALPLLAFGQESVPPDAPPSGEQPPALTGEEEAAEYTELDGRFKSLVASLRRAGSIQPEHHAAISLVLDEAEAFSARWPSHVTALAMQIQLRQWLNAEDPEVLELYRRMMELRPDDGTIAAAWLEHQMRFSDSTPEEMTEAYAELAARFPDNSDFLVGWAKTLMAEDQHDAALTVLESSDFSALEHPAVYAARAECEFFLRQYEDCVATLLEIEDARSSPDQNIRVVRRPYRAYIAWAVDLARDGQYAEAIVALEAVGFDPEESPDGVYALSDVLFGCQRFDDALTMIQTIPAEGFAGKPWLNPVRQDYEAKVGFYDIYPALWAAEQKIRTAEAEADDLPRVMITTTKGDIVVELFENEAPNTVANFISLAESDFYDQVKFHRHIPDFMIQGGDPNTKPGGVGLPGRGGPEYFIADEHTGENYRNHFSDSLSMAKSSAPNTAGSQFFFNHRPTPWLNGKHTVFGRVIEGRDVVLSLRQDDAITGMTVLRKRDHEYVPETLERDAVLKAVPSIPQPEKLSEEKPTLPTFTDPERKDPGKE